jgi:hypothetical protein
MFRLIDCGFQPHIAIQIPTAISRSNGDLLDQLGE